jgi:precorrin-2 dehydrogenase/sirohydrochlorin ferrochelatase
VSGAFAYPVFLEVRGRRCLVVGGGREAHAKATALAELGAHVVVSDDRHEATAALSDHAGVELRTGAFDPTLLEGVFLVVAASDDRVERRRIGVLAREAGALVSAVDENDLCDWAAPAILRRGGLTVALGTGGIAPSLAVRLRDRLAETLGPELGVLLELFGEVRPRIMASGRPFAERRQLWYDLVDGAALDECRLGRVDAARATIERTIDAWEAAS